MTKDRENPPSPDSSGTSKLSIITGGKDRTPIGDSKGRKKQRSAPSASTGLTEKQETFVQALLDGNSQRDAYQMAYDASGMSIAVIDSEASKLIRHPKVTQRLLSLEGEIEATRRARAVSRSDRILNLIESFAFDESLHPTVRTRNAELMAKHLGLFVDRVETKDVTDQDAAAIEERIKARLGL